MESECVNVKRERESPDKEEKKLADRRLVSAEALLESAASLFGADQGKENGKPSVICDVRFEEKKKKTPFLGLTWRTFRSTRQPGSSACAVGSWRYKDCQ